MAKPNNDYNLKQNELNSKNNNNLGITSFCNFRKKGFTLIEIMAIIILLSVISIIIIQSLTTQYLKVKMIYMINKLKS